MKTIEFDEQCTACKGTGLYIGMAERDGFAVVCHNCKGTGCYHFVHTYEEFSGRIDNPNIVQVVEVNPGIVLGIGKNLTYESFGGMKYSDWKNGHLFPPKSEMRDFTCPRWWQQNTGYGKMPKWEECSDNLGRSFSQCHYFEGKEKCWERFDKENDLEGK